VPDTGKRLLGLLEGWPQPVLPLWRRLEYRDKIPLPSWHHWKLTTGKVSMGVTPKWQGELLFLVGYSVHHFSSTRSFFLPWLGEGAEFDKWDPQGHLRDLKYHPLKDPALWRFCNAPSRRATLLSHQLITEDGNVRVGLKEYNQWRRDMFRQQLQLVHKKRDIAECNQLCGTIKGKETFSLIGVKIRRFSF
jgi:hypothetical protein